MSALATPASLPSALPVAQLRRVRWAVRATLTLGVAASVAANVLHARPNPISQVIAAWPPLALLLTVELISRIPVHRRSLGVVRLAATATIAGIAAWVSYWHMVGVAALYGEAGASPYLLPVSVDGLVIVASVSLVELAGRIRAAEQAGLVGSRAQPGQARTSPMEDVGSPAVVPPSVALPPDSHAGTFEPPAPWAPSGIKPPVRLGDTSRGEPFTGAGQPPTQPAAPVGPSTLDTGSKPQPPRLEPDATPDGEQRVTSADAPAVPPATAAAVAYWYRQDPTMHPSVIAEKIGRSERTVRRYWPPRPDRPVGRAATTAGASLISPTPSRPD